MRPTSASRPALTRQTATTVVPESLRSMRPTSASRPTLTRQTAVRTASPETMRQLSQIGKPKLSRQGAIIGSYLE